MPQRTSIKTQKGVTALAVTVIILFIMSIMVIYAARVGVMDQRMAGNEMRYREAFATAECGLDIAAERFNDQFSNFYGSSVLGFTTLMTNSGFCGSAANANRQCDDTACGGLGTSCFCVAVSDTGSSLPNGSHIFQFDATGTGADQTGTSTVSRKLSFAKVLGGKAPEVPIVVAGSVGSGGDFNIVANPNGGGPGVPVSIWTGNPPSNTDAEVEFNSNSAATCHIQYYSGNQAQCSNPASSEIISHGQTDNSCYNPATNPDGKLCSYNPAYPDVLPNDPNFPPDLFQYLFGVSRGSWASIRQMADNHGQWVTSCSGLDTDAGTKFRLWWIGKKDNVAASCALTSNQVIGSKTDPVILVIDDVEFSMQGAGGKVYGIVYLFNNPATATGADTTASAKPSADFNGSSEITGAFVSDVGGTDMDGSYSIVYDKDVLTSLTIESGKNYDMTYIPGSWRDY